MKHPCPDCGINLNKRHRCREAVVCAVCPTEFLPHKHGQKYCSADCRNRRPRLRGDRDRDHAKSRRRRLRHALTWDGITDEQILDRDRWRCGICKRKISQTLRYPHPKSKSIDHILPLSEGGDDTAANKRAAHFRCNVRRHNRGGNEQLLLIGWHEEPPLKSEVAGTVRERRKAAKPPKPLRRCGCGKELKPRATVCDSCLQQRRQRQDSIREGKRQSVRRNCCICGTSYAALDKWGRERRTCGRECGLALAKAENPGGRRRPARGAPALF